MKILFIQSIINEDWKQLNSLLIVLAILYACVFLSVLIDLFFGIRRAKRLKITRTSYGYRRTITKLTSYFGLMLMLTIADVAASVIFSVPYFTVLGAIGIVAIEAKSVFENIKQQQKGIEELPKTLLKILENKEHIQSIINFINTNKSEKS